MVLPDDPPAAPHGIAQLWLLVAELYDEAAVVLREHAELLPALSERLRRFLALGSALGLMRARRAWATHEASSGAAGSAVASLRVRLGVGARTRAGQILRLRIRDSTLRGSRSAGLVLTC